jgi:transcriptional regulator with XRE-family HTH domain
MHFVYTISPAQSKAARVYLEWSQEDLAKASDVSLSTVRSFENGFCPRRNMVIQIRKALEKAGVDFTECEGVRRRNDDVKVYRGAGNCEMFFNDLSHTVEEQGGEILCVTQSQKMMMHSCGIADHDDIERLEMLNDLAPIKCLIPEKSSSSVFPQSFQFRTTSRHRLGPNFYYIFGDKCAHVMPMSRMDFVFGVYRSHLVSDTYLAHFMSLWDSALPLVAAPQMQNGPASLSG